ncbi:MAG: hypothetical protein ACTSSH_02725 [Candidatus Heimdallarchaeota archaeon]
MNEKTLNLEQLVEILSSTWKTSEFTNGMLVVTGVQKTDTVEISVNDINAVANLLLQDVSSKVKSGAIEILGQFNNKSNHHVGNIAKGFFEFNEEEREIILLALRRIGTEEAILEFSSIIKNKPSYDVLFNIVVHIGDLLEKYPLEGLDALLGCRINDAMWKIITDEFNNCKQNDFKAKDMQKEIELKALRAPAIGISQEAAHHRLQLEIAQDHLYNAFIRLYELTTSENKKIKKDAMRIFKEYKSKT